MVLSRICLVSGALGVALGLGGCSHTASDASLTKNVQAKLAADPSINQQPVQVSTLKGVVTLSGNVSDTTASTVAAEDAARVPGVKQVVNSLTVAGAQVPPTVTSSSAPNQPMPATPQQQQALAQGQPLPPPGANPPPAPAAVNVTAPAGTTIPIRITEHLDSETAQDGEPFNGVVTHAVVAHGAVVIPAGAAVSGRVVEAHDAGHFKGHSLLSIRLTAVRPYGQVIPISTDAYTLEGRNRGKNSAEKIGGGAAVGALLGGILGHGKGAAIGALAGGGAGTVAQGVTRGQQVGIPSESLLRFRLERPLTVQTGGTP